MAVRNIFVRFDVIKAVTAYMLNCVVSYNLPRMYSFKFVCNIRSLLKYTGISRTTKNIM
jgi:hypothetical protein